ncbi:MULTISPECIES: CopG family ribbon-helix-helix protein [Acidianus]|uniref:Nickel-responsive regulator n=1 Tax=Candidatus Acidianus copahuensis TaxID=1160895 RepID=A0A031LNY5_9CREN|nr:MULTISPECIES: CopG family ribbon-helix-helix protein [Acidianus]EZQ04869.1 nickel-responsive regulator [Candidatus Acidianus copahuensis]NON61885.1 CopG family ribbon-helix-helix protein [Acidianus sp. RZ1]
MNVEKISVSLPIELSKDLENYMKNCQIRDRSKVFQMAIRNFLDENSVENREVIGILSVIYNAQATLDITEAQHKDLISVISTMHIHINEEDCMEAIAVKGKKDEVVKLSSHISSIRGVKKVRLTTYYLNENEDNYMR